MILGGIFCKEVHILLLVLSAICFSLWSIFSWVTGWRIGWAIAPAIFASAIRNIHVKITDSAPAPFQEAALTALESPSEYFESLRAVSIISFYIEFSWMNLNVWMAKFQKGKLTFVFALFKDYEMKRDYILKMLVGVGFQIKFKPQGSFFIFAELPHNYQPSDVCCNCLCFPFVYQILFK